MSTEIEIIQKLDNSVLQVIGNKALQGFQKAFTVSNAIIQLRELLTDDYMKPIMSLQGSKLGFRTDKDKSGGYDIAKVKDCLIDAVLMGLQPTGNQFNIIAGNMYPTKEGCGYLLNETKGLDYSVICEIKQISPDKTSALVNAVITWKFEGEEKTKTVPIPIKIDQYASVDSIIGKATRKGRAWLLSAITGVEITEGDASEYITIKPEPVYVDHELERATEILSLCKTVIELDEVFARDFESPDLREDIRTVYAELKAKL